jgi:uncharacterized protein with HEPN domain
VSRRDELRLGDILEAIDTIRGYLEDGAFDRKTSDAILHNLTVIGEAAGQISDEVQDLAPEIPWMKIVGLRNLITHEYFRVDLSVIQTIIDEQLDALEEAATRLLDQAGADA